MSDESREDSSIELRCGFGDTRIFLEKTKVACDDMSSNIIYSFFFNQFSRQLSHYIGVLEKFLMFSGHFVMFLIQSCKFS